MTAWQHVRYDFSAMASPCCLLIDGQDAATIEVAAQAAIAEVRRIEHKYSRYRDDSVIADLARAQGDWCEVDDETESLLNFAAALWHSSDGLFDITSGVLRQCWDFKRQQRPEPAALERTLARVGWLGVEREDHRIRCTRPGMELDLGGFGKEYAVDRAAVVLKAHGIAHALVNLGGDVFALGGRGLPDLAHQGWQVAIENPRPQEAPAPALPILSLVNQGMATSGDYERFFILDGQRYCHVLNPKTGWPVTHFRSVTVVAPTASAAGAMTTIAMLKERDGLDWLRAQALPFVAVDHTGCVVQQGIDSTS